MGKDMNYVTIDFSKIQEICEANNKLSYFRRNDENGTSDSEIRIGIGCSVNDHLPNRLCSLSTDHMTGQGFIMEVNTKRLCLNGMPRVKVFTIELPLSKSGVDPTVRQYLRTKESRDIPLWIFNTNYLYDKTNITMSIPDTISLSSLILGLSTFL